MNYLNNYANSLQVIWINYKSLSETIALIDVQSCLAWLAWQNGYCCPEFTEQRTLKIIEGRHPVIKLLTDTDFIPNDTELIILRLLSL